MQFCWGLAIESNSAGVAAILLGLGHFGWSRVQFRWGGANLTGVGCNTVGARNGLPKPLVLHQLLRAQIRGERGGTGWLQFCWGWVQFCLLVLGAILLGLGQFSWGWDNLAGAGPV